MNQLISKEIKKTFWYTIKIWQSGIDCFSSSTTITKLWLHFQGQSKCLKASFIFSVDVVSLNCFEYKLETGQNLIAVAVQLELLHFCWNICWKKQIAESQCQWQFSYKQCATMSLIQNQPVKLSHTEDPASTRCNSKN